MKENYNFIDRLFYLFILFWTSLMLLAAASSFYSTYKYSEKLATHEAIVNVKKDNAYRLWAASHGGVYVPISKKTPPNPYLAHIKNRDINTTDSQQLTLMNPAYIRSQMMKDYSKLYGIKGHITSKKLLNPKNAADEWEDKALETMETTGKPVIEKTVMDGEEYLRYISPLFVERSCLKCHAQQGYKVGDLRGGVSVAIPMKEYFEDAYSNILVHATIALLIWLTGLAGIFYMRTKAKVVARARIKNYEQSIYSLVDIIENRDSYTAGHTQRVARYSILIAKEMGLGENEIDELYRACMLHDIGKISTPDSILLKPGKLTELEYKIIQEHARVGYELLNKVDIYKDIAELVYTHHERCDGKGYPRGLKSEQIPKLSKIMMVSDSFDAMTTSRVYKSKKTIKEAFIELEKNSGKQFNKRVVDAAKVALMDVEVLENISQRPKSKLEKERFSYFYRDQVTKCYNRNYLEFILAYEDNENLNLIYAYSVDIFNFSQYNKKHSWQEGDKLLYNIAKVLEEISGSEYVFRIYGDDFIVLTQDTMPLADKAYKIDEVLEGTNVNFTHRCFDLKNLDIKSLERLEELL